MTREENLHWIDQEIQTWENECQSKHPIKEALYAARKVLEQEPCEDAISRKEVRDTIFRECSGEKLDIDFAKVLLLQRKIPKPKKGYWIKEESLCGWDGHSYQCSECGRSIHLDTEMEDLEDYPYCHCGAKMQEVQDNGNDN